MAFSFDIAKPQNIKNALLATKQKIAKSGGTFSGDERSGRFSGKGVTGVYTVGSDAIKITITNKPALYPMQAVKNAIEDYFR